ncbi:hypothetical protein Tco_1071681 [Tanacetum coccineum]
MLCYLTGMEPYYIQCIKDGHFQTKTAEGANKSEEQWSNDDRRVVNQDQILKSIIISCLTDDIMESVIRCKTAKETWTDLVHSFEGLSDTKENRIMDLKLEYETFRVKPSERLRNANHIQTLDLADIYERFVYEDNLISRRYPESKKTLTTTLSTTPISIAFFFNNIVQDFQENSDDEVDERTSDEYLRDLDIEFHERSIFVRSKRFIKRRNNFQVHKQMKTLSASNVDEEEVSDDEVMTQVNVLVALVNDELVVGKNHARNGKWINITMRKVNILLSMDEDADWQTYFKILVPESQAVIECLKLTKATTDPESSKESGSEPQTPLPPPKVL